MAADEPVVDQGPLDPEYALDFLDRDMKVILDRKRLFIQMARRVLPQKILRHLDLENAEPQETRFLETEIRSRFSDVFWKVPWINDPKRPAHFVYILIENQSSVDPEMSVRLYGYRSRLWDRERVDRQDKKITTPYVPATMIPVVFHLEPAKWNGPKDLKTLMDPHEALDEITPSEQAIYWSLGNFSWQSLLDDEYELFQALAVARVQNLVYKTYHKVFLAVVQKLVNSTKISDKEKKDLLGLVLDYTLNKRPLDEWKKLIQAAKPLLSRFKEAESMVQIREDSVAGVNFRRGLEKGMEDGREEGLAEGIQAFQTALSEILTKRFENLPQSVLDRITQCDQLSRLQNAVINVYNIRSLNELVL